MRLRDSDDVRRLVAQRIARQAQPDVIATLTDEWFQEERAFFDDPSPLAAAECGRRAGKTRGICRDLVRGLLTTPGYRALYLNSTRGEAERLAWWGNRNDGMAALVHRYKLPIKLDNARLTLRNERTDGWVYLRGADDEAELRKALGGAYHKVYFDEGQKIPPKLAQSIREVFFPALLDFGGQFRLTGTPVRNMSGLFWDVTRPEVDKREKGWSVHHWTLLENPFFGPDRETRWKRGVLGLQTLYGGPEVAPIDSPIMQREAFGRWVREDAAYVYAVNKVKPEQVLYAPARTRPDGFPDIARALLDLPFHWTDGMFALGCDLGWFPDPFAFVLWAWHVHDPNLYEVASWRKTHLTSDQQVACLQDVQSVVNLGLIVADASGPAKPTVKGWSADWVTRYNMPIIEADKQHKYVHIDVENNDIIRGRLKMRESGALYEEMSQLQWASVVTGTGRMVEDPTLPNDVCDAGLYSHRHSYQYRWQPEDKQPPRGSFEALRREEAILEEEMLEDAGESVH